MGSKHPILVVDDERENLNLLGNVLGNDHVVYKAQNSAAALEVLKREEIHLVITDQRMPGESGVSLLEKARAIRPEATRVLITAYPDVNVAIDAINRGQVKRYISKPFDPAELKIIVRQELEVYELQQSNKRLLEEQGRLVNELLKANKELKELDSMKDHFLANVSHELKTPLVSGIGYIDLLLSGGLGKTDERQQKGLRIAYRNLNRLLALIEDLLSLAKMRRRPEGLAKTRFGLGPLLEECVESLRVRARKKSLTVTISCPRALPPVEADERKIHSVITNVLSNAEKFTPDEARIAIRVRRGRKGKCAVRISDNGIGVRKSEAESKFQFFRHADDEVSKKYGGLGVGLMLARQILEAHGCAISLERGPRGGAVVLFDLPLAGTRDRPDGA